jgi:hypothetical protein
MERTTLVITAALAACGGPGKSQPVAAPLVPSPSAKPASDCDKVLAERADYRVCAIGDRLVEVIKGEDGAWTRGASVPARQVLDQLAEVVLLGGDCDVVDESAAPARTCVFGRSNVYKSTKKTYDFPPQLGSRPSSPRSVALASYGRLVATNGAQIGAVGLHASAWRVAPLDLSFVAAGCSAPVIVAPLARTDFKHTFSIGYTCGDRSFVADAVASLFEDSNEIKVDWRPPRPR